MLEQGPKELPGFDRVPYGCRNVENAYPGMWSLGINQRGDRRAEVLSVRALEGCQGLESVGLFHRGHTRSEPQFPRVGVGPRVELVQGTLKREPQSLDRRSLEPLLKR